MALLSLPGLHRSTKREQIMKHKCYDLEGSFKLLKEQSAKVCMYDD